MSAKSTLKKIFQILAEARETVLKGLAETRFPAQAQNNTQDYTQDKAQKTPEPK